MTRSSGLITVFNVIEYPPCGNRSFEIVYPESMDYIRAIMIADKLRKAGTPLGAIDILIAAMGINRSLTLITKDKGFQAIKAVTPEFSLTVLA